MEALEFWPILAYPRKWIRAEEGEWTLVVWSPKVLELRIVVLSVER